jgi:hypothetical protein
VATDVLGDRVNDHIGTEVKRVLEIGSEEGVVNDHESLLLLADLSDAGNIADLEGGIRRGLGPDNLGVGLYRFADNIKIAKVNKVDSDSLTLVQDTSHVSLSTTINIINTKNVVSTA